MDLDTCDATQSPSARRRARVSRDADMDRDTDIAHRRTRPVRCWRDPVVERVGFDACGDYVELFWLPVIGPTSTLLLRRLAIMAVLNPNNCSIDDRDTSLALGLGSDTGPRSSFIRSVERLTTFGLARVIGGTLEVRTTVPPLTMKQLARLPDHLQLAHSLWSEASPANAHGLAYGSM